MFGGNPVPWSWGSMCQPCLAPGTRVPVALVAPGLGDSYRLTSVPNSEAGKMFSLPCLFTLGKDPFL